MNNINIVDAAVLSNLAYKINRTRIYKPTNIDEKHLFHNTNMSVYTTYINPDQSGFGVQGIINESNDCRVLIISIRGSNDVVDWLDNLDIKPVSVCSENTDLCFHKGFYDEAKELLDQFEMALYKDTKHIFLNGHSAGGPICSILGYLLKQMRPDIPMTIVTFASPMFCNYTAVHWFAQNTNYFRVENAKDIVPKLVFGEDYVHVNSNVSYIMDNMVLNSAPLPDFDLYALLEKPCCSLFCCKDELDLNEHKILVYIQRMKDLRFKRNLN